MGQPPCSKVTRTIRSYRLFSLGSQDTAPAPAIEQIGRNRKELTRKSWIRFRLRGLEDFLRELNRLAIICLGFDKSITVSRLVVRALHDFILAVDGTLSGQHVIVFESMRDVMEIELLIREFQNGPQRIQEGLNPTTLL